MSEKLNPFDIVYEHMRTLRNNQDDKISKWDIFVFYGMPLLFGGVFLFNTKSGYSEAASTLWIAALSVLAGLLINVLVLLYTVQTTGPTEEDHDNQRKLIKEVNANLLYTILVAIIAICGLCISPVLPNWLSYIVGAPVTFLISNFVLTLFMSVKRIKVIVGMRFVEN